MHFLIPRAPAQAPAQAIVHPRHNVAQGLLRVVQRTMAAGVMIELYRQMAEVSLFCFVNNALPKLKQHLYENMDRFYTVEEVVALAERYETGHSGGSISKFSIAALNRHLNYTGDIEIWKPS